MAVSAHPPSIPLRFLLAVLLAASCAWTGPLAARWARSDGKAGCVATRAAVLRAPDCRASIVRHWRRHATATVTGAAFPALRGGTPGRELNPNPSGVPWSS
jgi:hypothetical protein